MKTTTRVAVIGGGVVGCSVLYHLTKLGWSDVMLIERSELTSGSTWHAAGGFHTLNGDTNMAALCRVIPSNSTSELEEITGMSCGLHHVGGVTLADNQERFDMLKAERAKHRFMGLETTSGRPRRNQEDCARHQHRRHHRRALRSARRPSGSVRHHPRLCQGRAHGRRHDRNPLQGDRDQPARRRHLGRGDRTRAPSTPSMWSTPAASGRAKSAPWRASTSRCTRWSISISSPTTCPRLKRSSTGGGEHPHVMDPAGESYLRQEGKRPVHRVLRTALQTLGGGWHALGLWPRAAAR